MRKSVLGRASATSCSSATRQSLVTRASSVHFADIEGEVTIGDEVSLQSGCYLTRGVVIESLVFCGPRLITMNDRKITYRRPSLTFVREAPRINHAARVGGGV